MYIYKVLIANIRWGDLKKTELVANTCGTEVKAEVGLFKLRITQTIFLIAMEQQGQTFGM